MLSQYRDWKWGHSGRGNQKDEEKILTEEGGIQRTRGLSTHLAGSKFLIKWIVHKNGQWDLGTGYCGSPRECAAKSDMSTFFEKIIFLCFGGPQHTHLSSEYQDFEGPRKEEDSNPSRQVNDQRAQQPNRKTIIEEEGQMERNKIPSPIELWEEKRY